MENAKEKAKEIVQKYFNLFIQNDNNAVEDIIWEQAKQCALICIDLMTDEHTFVYTEYANRRFLCLIDVKKEIENL